MSMGSSTCGCTVVEFLLILMGLAILPFVLLAIPLVIYLPFTAIEFISEWKRHG